MKKIGRNEPCPCGSGKKFKNCHLGKEDEIIQDGMSEFSEEMSARITNLKTVAYGRSQEMVESLDIKELTGGSPIGIKFIEPLTALLSSYFSFKVLLLLGLFPLDFLGIGL